jgi:hypothetical protein
MTGRRERLILRRICESGTKSCHSLPTLSERGAGGAITPIIRKNLRDWCNENSGDTNGTNSITISSQYTRLILPLKYTRFQCYPIMLLKSKLKLARILVEMVKGEDPFHPIPDLRKSVSRRWGSAKKDFSVGAS